MSPTPRADALFTRLCEHGGHHYATDCRQCVEDAFAAVLPRGVSIVPDGDGGIRILIEANVRARVERMERVVPQNEGPYR